MVVGLRSNANDGPKQASPLVVKAIGGSDKHFPTSWSASGANQLAKESSDFLNSFERADTNMIWRGYDIRLNSPAALQASILNKPVFFLNENIVHNGSISASGKLIIGGNKEIILNIPDHAESAGSPIEGNKKSGLIQDGKIDMDLILIISAGVSGLILILIPERKRKRDLIKEANLALLRRPRQ